MRVKDHPILGPLKEREVVEIIYNGKKLKSYKGDSVASALIANGVLKFRESSKIGESRGYFCGIGLCTDCMMKVNGIRNVRTCITEVKENMIVETE